MSERIQVALQRAEAVFRRRPEAGIHDDSPASAQWLGGTRVDVHHENGARFETDMPVELGGDGRDVTPGWLFRAGVAACAATSIALMAAAEGIRLTALRVRAGSRSDARGILGMVDGDGTRVPAGPDAIQLRVRIAASDASSDRLRALTEEALRRSPIPCAVGRAMPLRLDFEIDTP